MRRAPRRAHNNNPGVARALEASNALRPKPVRRRARNGVSEVAGNPRANLSPKPGTLAAAERCQVAKPPTTTTSVTAPRSGLVRFLRSLRLGGITAGDPPAAPRGLKGTLRSVANSAPTSQALSDVCVCAVAILAQAKFLPATVPPLSGVRSPFPLPLAAMVAGIPTPTCASHLMEAAMRGLAQGGTTRQIAAAVAAAITRVVLNGAENDPEITGRLGPIKEALTLHKALDDTTGQHFHNLGTALKDAKTQGILSHDNWCKARRIQRSANKARHEPFLSEPTAGVGEGTPPCDPPAEFVARADAPQCCSAFDRPGSPGPCITESTVCNHICVRR